MKKYHNPYLGLGRKLFLLLAIGLFSTALFAEGTRQAAPTQEDSPVMLETGRPEFGNFAAYDGPATSRLYVTVNDPNETVYLGLSVEYGDTGEPLPVSTFSQYRFRIRKDNNGGFDPIVHGPYTVSVLNANLTSWDQAVFGNYDVTTTQNGELMYQFAPGEAGDYYIEFTEGVIPDNDTKVNIGLWDITVTDGSNQPIDGRVWSRNWAFRTPSNLESNDQVLPDCRWDREFNGVLYTYTSDNFVSKIDFSGAGLQGLSFNVAFNVTGPGNTGELDIDRMSIPNVNATDNSAVHRIFLNEPDPNVFPDGECGTITPASSFMCLGEDGYCIDVTVTKPGQVEMILDFNQNGVFDPDSLEVSIVQDFPPNQLSACIEWDGLRADGSRTNFGSSVDLIFVYSQGIQHWSAYDVEFLKNGFCIETIRPICSPALTSNILYYDDRNINLPSGTGQPLDGRSGGACEDGFHSWTNFDPMTDDCSTVVDNNTVGYGDKNTINTWWFANNNTFVRADIPVYTCLISGPDSICVGTAATYSVAVDGSAGPSSYQWSGPNGFSSEEATIENITEGGEYCVTVTNTDNCLTECCRTLYVTDDGFPEVEYDTSVDACIGDEITFEPIGDITGLSFNWSPGASLSDSTIANPSFTVTESTAYTVIVGTIGTNCEKVININVNAIDVPEADFSTFLNCDGLTIDFTNESTNASSYAWDFGDPNTTSDISFDENPSYAYPAIGTYTVTLVATNGGLCSDTLVRDITINSIDLSADFSVSYADCASDSVVVQFTDESVNSQSNTTGWEYTISPTGQTSNDPNPSFTFFTSQTITVTYTITNADNCTNTIVKDIDVQLGPITDQFPDTLLVCPGDSTTINPAGDNQYTYSWNPTTGLDDPSSNAPTFFPNQSTMYTVTVSSLGADTCTVVEEVFVFVPPVIGLSVTGDGPTCQPTSLLSATSTEPANYEWTNENGDVISSEATVTVNVSGPADYTVTATDQYGCMESLTVSVTGGPVDISVPDTVAVCFGEEVMLSVDNLDPNDTLVYSWTPIDLFAPGTTNLASPDYLEAIGEETVSVQVVNQFGCDAEETVTIAVVDPNAMLSFTSEIQCNGATVEFTNTSTDAFGYIWTFGDGATSFDESPTHTYTEAGTYTVILSIVYDVDCVDDFEQTITVDEPQILSDFSYQIVDCSLDGASIQFTDQSTNTFNNTIGYSWTFEDATPGTSPEQNPLVTGATSPLTVTFTIFTANDCEASITREIEFDLTDIDLADTLVVCLGDSGILNPNGDTSLTYQWSPIIGLDNPTAVSPVVTPTETTTYYVTVTGSGDAPCVSSDSIIVFVPGDIDLDIGTGPIETCGEDVTLTASANVDVTVSWESSIEGPLGTGPSITVNPFRTDTIYATATDIYGCTDMDTIVVIDNGVDIEIEQGTNITACQGLETLITVVNLDSLDTLSYNWVPEEYIVSQDSNTITIVVDSGTVIFTGIITNQLGCSDTVDVQVTVEPFMPGLMDSVFVCSGESTPINPDGDPNLSYNWMPADNLDNPTSHNPIFTATGPLEQTYSVTVTDNDGCTTVEDVIVVVSPDLMLMVSPVDTNLCSLAPLTINADSPIPDVTFEWFEEDFNMPIGTGGSITVTPENGTTTYFVIATDINGCSDTLSSTANVQVFENGVPPDTVTVCENVPTPINPDGNPAFEYTWSPLDNLDLNTIGEHNPLVTTDQPAVYFVTITDPSFMCTVLDTVYIELFPEPTGEVVTEDTILCESGPIDLIANTDAANNIEWFDNPECAGDPVATGSPATVTPPLGTTIYYLKLTNEFGCSEVVDSVQVDNYPLQAVITPPIVICEPTESVQLEVTNGDPNNQVLTIEWNPLGVTPTTGPIVTADPNVTREFSAVVTNQFGCTDTLMTTVDIVDFTDLDIMAEPDTIVLGNSTVITVTGCDDCNYTWFPPSGDVDPDDGPVVTATPDVPGLQTYEVEVEKFGCVEILMVDVLVIDAMCDGDHVFIPTAFTPNNDGVNDDIRLYSPFIDEITDMELLIYNRWGEEMYRSTDPFGVWDGTYQGDRLPPDVYGYYLRVVCPDEQELIQKGNINLIR